MKCWLFNHAGLAGDIRHVPFGFDAQQTTHIPIGICAFVICLGTKAAAKPVKEIIQALRRLLDFIQGYAPTGNFSDPIRSCVIPLFMPPFRLFG
jgi:hypothetical protein